MNRTLSLALGMLIVFAVTALILSRVMPGPHKPTDYLVIGGVATIFCLVLLFAVLVGLPGRSGKAKR